MGPLAQPLLGRRILVVEDDPLIALAVSSVLEDVGACVVGPIATVEEAVAMIEEGDAEIHAAVLDVDLNGEKSYPIADALVLREIGFVFTTAYGIDAIEVRYRHNPRCQKPVNYQMLIDTLIASVNKQGCVGADDALVDGPD